VRFWDGSEQHYGQGAAKFTLIIRSENTIQKIIGGGTLAFGEEYMEGNLNVEGDLQAMTGLSAGWGEISGKTNWKQKLVMFCNKFYHVPRQLIKKYPLPLRY